MQACGVRETAVVAVDTGRTPHPGAPSGSGPTRAGRVVVFGPSPLLEVSLQVDGAGATRISVVAGGQAVWVARMAALLGSEVTLFGLGGGQVGTLVQTLLADQPFRSVIVPTGTESGCFVVDQRHEPATEVASAWAAHPTGEQVETLVDATCEQPAEAVLVVCNPMLGDALPLPTFTRLVDRATSRGQTVVVDLSTPRLDAALRGGPVLVKLNDWELAELVTAPVSRPGECRAAVERLQQMGARSVVVTRGGAPACAVDELGTWVELIPPAVTTGAAAGCGDAMTGALAAAIAAGSPWLQAVRLGMAAGAAHYRWGDATTQAEVESMTAKVRWRAVGA